MFLQMDNATIKKQKNRPCANCKQQVKGNYCTHCGQSTMDMHQPFWHLIISFIGEAFAFDGRFFHTLKLLIIKPWVLTSDFMKGKRVCYTPPFRMYLFAAFFAFLLLSINLSEELKQKFVVIEDSSGQNNKQDVNQTHIKEVLNKIKTFSESQPSLFADIVLKKASQSLLVLFPLYALLLWLFYYPQKRYFIEHLLISLNFHTFMLIVIMLNVSLMLVHLDILGIAILLFIPVQMYRTLKHYYQQSIGFTLLKITLLIFCYSLLLFGVFIIGVMLLLYKFW